MVKSTVCLGKTATKIKTWKNSRNKKIKTSEILNRKTNSKVMIQMASMTQAERKTKLERTSSVWDFWGWGRDVFCLVLNVWHAVVYLYSILFCCPPKSIDLDQRWFQEMSCLRSQKDKTHQEQACTVNTCLSCKRPHLQIRRDLAALGSSSVLPNSVSSAGHSWVERVWNTRLKVGKLEASYCSRGKTAKTYTDVEEVLSRNFVQPAKLNTTARDFALKGSIDYYTIFKD